MADDFETAVLLSFDHTGAVDPVVKERAVAYCDELKLKRECFALFVERFTASQRLEVKFWCLQALLEVVHTRYETLGTETHGKFRQTLMGWISSEEVATQPPLVRNKLAQVVTAVIQRDFPKRWPGFFRDLLTSIQKGPSMVDMFSRIMQTIDSDVITLDIHRSAEGGRLSMHLKDSLRETCIGDIVEAWYRLVTMYHSDQPQLAADVLRTVQRYIGWMDIGLVANDKFIPLLFNLLGSRHAEMQECSVECLTEILHKRMDHSAKLDLIQKLNLLPSCSQWRTELPGTDDDDLKAKCAKLLSTLCNEIIDCWKIFENKLVSFKAINMELNKGTAKELNEACNICEQMIDQLFPAIMAVLKDPDKSVAMTVMAFLVAYVARLKNFQKRTNAIPEKALTHIRCILDGLAMCSRYPDDSAFPPGQHSSDLEKAAALEEQCSVLEDRRELVTLFKNLARIATNDTVIFVSERLNAVLANPQSTFQNVEVFATLLFELGEACTDEIQKKDCGLLGPLVLRLMQSSIPNANHRLVALVVLEVYVRYAKVSVTSGRNLAGVVATFVDSRGILHPVETVANRACYLFMRFVKITRSSLRPLTMGILSSLQPFLQQVAQTPKVDFGGPGSSTFSAANDDRMCVYEAAGMLLGAEEMQAEDQQQVAVMLLLPLKVQIEGSLNAHNQQSLLLVQQALEGISRLSKGFKQHVVTTLRPELGQLFLQCLELALRVPQVFPESKSLRTRFISFLHRMVETLGPQTLKYLPNVLEVLLHPGCDVADMIEVVAVVNQLTNRFTNTLEELMEKVLPVLVAEIHSKLGEGWDWSGVLCLQSKGDVQKGASTLVEENREKGDLQKAYYSLLHVTVSSKLDGVLLKLPEATLKVILSALIEGASSHMDPAVRKSCIQVLLELVDGWADRISTDQGLKWFVMEKIGGDVCIQGIFRGGLDPKDAATVAFLSEVGGMLKLIRDKCGYEFLVHLNGTVFPKLGLPPDFQSELVNRIQVADPKETKNFMKAALMRLSR